MFGRLLGCYTIYTFWGLLPPDGILPRAVFTLRPSLAFSYIGSVTAWHSSSGPPPNFAAWYKDWNYGTFAEGPPIFGWAAITLGIGQHSSLVFFLSLWLPYVIGQTIIFLRCYFYLLLLYIFLFSSPNLSGRRLMCTILWHMVWP